MSTPVVFIGHRRAGLARCNVGGPAAQDWRLAGGSGAKCPLLM
ncbi:hypothetical protein FHR47_000773 [Xanthomonas arboricola]|nr:hypothetical protein [Xanthomonas cannabis]NIK18503.1 hypothetical protein [Xanthomonas cannabis]